jgi:transcriptional regulator with XRE-family HTH domain
MRNSENETLPEFISRVMDEGRLSGAEVERLSNKAISQSQINRIRAGKSANPSLITLKALALGLGVQEEKLFAIVRGSEPDSMQLAHEGVKSLITKFDQIPIKRRPYAQNLIEMLNREFDRLSQAD